MIRYAFVAAFLFGFIGQANAALVWHNGLSIRSVGYVWTGSGTTDAIEVVFNEPIATGCAASDSGMKMGYVQVLDEPFKLRYTALLSAMTANKKVDMLVDTASCNATYGVRIAGIRVVN